MSRKLTSVSTPETPTLFNPEPILTGEQLATRLQVNSSTIYELTRRRNKRPLPAMRVGKALRFYFSEVEKWMRGEGKI
jgi:excisionase family DNA binding protein